MTFKFKKGDLIWWHIPDELVGRGTEVVLRATVIDVDNRGSIMIRVGDLTGWVKEGYVEERGSQ